jgi:hypothetical protein
VGITRLEDGLLFVPLFEFDTMSGERN